MKEMRYKGYPVSYRRKPYENEFVIDTSNESDKEFIKNHKIWINNNYAKKDSYRKSYRWINGW